MDNVYMAVTSSIHLLGPIIKTCDDAVNEGKQIYDYIDSKDPDDEDYSGSIRKKVNDFVDDTTKEIENLSTDNKTLVTNLTIIRNNKNDEIVIRNLRVFNEYIKSIDNLLKKYDFVNDDMEDTITDAKFNKNYTLAVNCRKLKSILDRFYFILSHDMVLLDSVAYGKKNTKKVNKERRKL